MAQLRQDCPWDKAQTHRSLVPYLVEEAGEVVEAIESGGPADLREELGDLLLQVYFHAEIARQEGHFDIGEVAEGIIDKLVRRHPHVFGGQDVAADLHVVWEEQKRAEKGRTSALQGIPTAVDPLTRGSKVISRAKSHKVPLDLPADEITADQAGQTIIALLARADASGVDVGQAARDAIRGLETEIRKAEREQG